LHLVFNRVGIERNKKKSSDNPDGSARREPARLFAWLILAEKPLEYIPLTWGLKH
jgi:hypothetical protein